MDGWLLNGLVGLVGLVSYGLLLSLFLFRFILFRSFSVCFVGMVPVF